MTQYKRCEARPEYSRGLSRVEVCRRLGVPLPTQQVEKPKEEVSEVVVVEDSTVEVQKEPAVENATVEEPVIETVEEVAEVETPEEVVTDTVVETPVEELNVSKKQIEMLKANDLNTIEELVAFVESGNDLEDLPKIGQAAKKSILEGLEEWQNAQNQTK